MRGISICAGALLSALLLVSVWVGNVRAMDLMKSSRSWTGSLELGTTVDGSFSSRLVGAWWLPKEMAMGENGSGSVRLELDLGVLDSRDTTVDAGVQPVFRYSYGKYGIKPYLDLGAGIHFLSRSNIRGRQMGAAFQFSVLAGTGLCFHDRWELGYRYLHISNADIHDNNDGRDEHLGVLTLVF